VKTAIAFGLTVLLAGCYRPPPPAAVSQRDLFDMKQQCAESIPRVLKYAIDFGENTTAIRTHYNAKLNRCFVLIKWQLRNPALPVADHWVIADAQSYAHVETKPDDPVWRDAMEDEDLDAVVPRRR